MITPLRSDDGARLRPRTAQLTRPTVCSRPPRPHPPVRPSVGTGTNAPSAGLVDRAQDWRVVQPVGPRLRAAGTAGGAVGVAGGPPRRLGPPREPAADEQRTGLGAGEPGAGPAVPRRCLGGQDDPPPAPGAHRPPQGAGRGSRDRAGRGAAANTSCVLRPGITVRYHGPVPVSRSVPGITVSRGCGTPSVPRFRARPALHGRPYGRPSP
jgi:hypothetical protein